MNRAMKEKMSQSMNIRRLPLLLGLGLLAACGQQFDLPPQPPPQVPVEIDTYNLAKIWSVEAPSAMASQGSLIYVIKGNQSIGAYFVNDQVANQASIVSDFEGLIRPVQIAVAQRESIYVYVADEGDMSIKRYHFTGGSPLVHRFALERVQRTLCGRLPQRLRLGCDAGHRLQVHPDRAAGHARLRRRLRARVREPAARPLLER